MTDFGLDDVRPAVVAIDCHHGHRSAGINPNMHRMAALEIDEV
jgi:hypothetical protein